MSTYKPLPIGIRTTNKVVSLFPNFKEGHLIPLSSSINSIEFNPSDPDQYLITSGLHAKVFDVNSSKPIYSVNNIKDTSVYSGTFRRDGEFFALGAGNGVVKVVQPDKKVVMKQIQAHDEPAYCVRWLDSANQVLTFSDDCSIKCFDFITETCLQEYEGHTKEVRIGAVQPNSTHCFLSGSMDQTVKFYDQRVSNECIYSLETGSPVESLLYLPGGNFVSAGGVSIKIWDASSRRLVHNFVKHSETVSALSLTSSQNHLLTASIDGMVHAYNLKTYNIDNSIKTEGVILCMDIGAHDEYIIVGTKDGYISSWKKSAEIAPARIEEYKRGSQKRLYEDDSGVLLREVRAKLSKPDQYLIRFKHGKALEQILLQSSASERNDNVLVILEELIDRSALHKALKNINHEAFKILCEALPKLCERLGKNETITAMQTLNEIVDLYNKETLDEKNSSLVETLKAKFDEEKIMEKNRKHANVLSIVT